MESTKEGWLVKKGGRSGTSLQKRYVCLRRSVLVYFLTAEDATGDPRGMLSLLGAEIVDGDECSWKIIPAAGAKVKTDGKIYEFVADGVKQKAEWLKVLDTAIHPTNDEYDDEDGTAIRQGWLYKNGGWKGAIFQKRFAVLRGVELQWYLNPKATKGPSRGRMTISGATITDVAGGSGRHKHAWKVQPALGASVHTDKKIYLFAVDSAEDKAKWCAHLVLVAKQKPQQYFFFAVSTQTGDKIAFFLRDLEAKQANLVKACAALKTEKYLSRRLRDGVLQSRRLAMETCCKVRQLLIGSTQDIVVGGKAHKVDHMRVDEMATVVQSFWDVSLALNKACFVSILVLKEDKAQLSKDSLLSVYEAPDEVNLAPQEQFGQLLEHAVVVAEQLRQVQARLLHDDDHSGHGDASRTSVLNAAPSAVSAIAVDSPAKPATTAVRAKISKMLASLASELHSGPRLWQSEFFKQDPKDCSGTKLEYGETLLYMYVYSTGYLSWSTAEAEWADNCCFMTERRFVKMENGQVVHDIPLNKVKNAVVKDMAPFKWDRLRIFAKDDSEIADIGVGMRSLPVASFFASLLCLVGDGISVADLRGQ